MRCGFKIIILFALLAILINFFLLPVHQIYITEQYTLSGIGTRTTYQRSSYMSLLIFLKVHGNRIDPYTGQKMTTNLRISYFLIQNSILLLLTIIDYLIFCVWLRSRSLPAQLF